MSLKNLLRSLRAADALAIAFIVLLSTIILIFSGSINEWLLLIFLNLAASAGIIAISHVSPNTGSLFLRAIHDWYPVPGIFLMFKEVHVIIQSLGTNDWDDLFIAADRWLFGTDPTVWLTQFSSPLLTEILQLSYFSYYVLLLALGLELYPKEDKQKFSYAVFTILYGFFLSYLGYIAFPAVGPRFTLHNFGTLNDELPGLVFTNALRDLINAGESIPKDAVNPLALAQRDAFPSGHTQMTLIVMFFAVKYHLKTRYILHLLGCLLIIGTVYLRYHYVIDLIGGALLMLLTIWSAPKLFDWWERRLKLDTNLSH